MSLLTLAGWRSEWARILSLAYRDTNKHLGPYRISQAVGAMVFIAIYLARLFGVHTVTDLWKLLVAGTAGWLTVYALTFLWRLFVVIPSLTSQHKDESGSARVEIIGPISSPETWLERRQAIDATRQQARATAELAEVLRKKKNREDE